MKAFMIYRSWQKIKKHKCKNQSCWQCMPSVSWRELIIRTMSSTTTCSTPRPSQNRLTICCRSIPCRACTWETWRSMIKVQVLHPLVLISCSSSLQRKDGLMMTRFVFDSWSMTITVKTYQTMQSAGQTRRCYMKLWLKMLFNFTPSTSCKNNMPEMKSRKSRYSNFLNKSTALMVLS